VEVPVPAVVVEPVQAQLLLEVFRLSRVVVAHGGVVGLLPELLRAVPEFGPGGRIVWSFDQVSGDQREAGAGRGDAVRNPTMDGRIMAANPPTRHTEPA